MDKPVTRAFLYEVLRQSKNVMRAVREADTALRFDEVDRLWFNLEAFLVSSAHVSRLLFPRDRDAAVVPERGPELRAMLDVPDDSPFSEKALSNVRNHFEHFDSRLTSWASEDASLTFVDGNIGPGDMIDIEGMPTYREMRHYDPATGDISCWGDTVNARSVLRATVELIPKVEAALEKL